MNLKVLGHHLKFNENSLNFKAHQQLVHSILPSKLPVVAANSINFPYVLALGVKTKTPLLKQSGHPTSGAAENSSRSKSSSQFLRI